MLPFPEVRESKGKMHSSFDGRTVLGFLEATPLCPGWWRVHSEITGHSSGLMLQQEQGVFIGVDRSPLSPLSHSLKFLVSWVPGQKPGAWTEFTAKCVQREVKEAVTRCCKNLGAPGLGLLDSYVGWRRELMIWLR